MNEAEFRISGKSAVMQAMYEDGLDEVIQANDKFDVLFERATLEVDPFEPDWAGRMAAWIADHWWSFPERRN